MPAADLAATEANPFPLSDSQSKASVDMLKDAKDAVQSFHKTQQSSPVLEGPFSPRKAVVLAARTALMSSLQSVNRLQTSLTVSET